MKRYTGKSSRLSNYQYSSKKSTWKWTPAKIAAFSLFGIMMATLVYLESNSSRSSYQPVANSNNSPSASTSSDFEKEYQEFLKKGKKIVSQETLDSLNAIQNIPQIQASFKSYESDETAVEDLPETESTRSGSENEALNSQATESVRPPQNTRGNLTPEIREKKQESAGFSLPSNAHRTLEAKKNTLGTLEEASPDEYSSTSSGNANQVRTRTEESGKAITEEFYTEDAITGRVTALSDGVPIQGVQILVMGTTNTAVSDANGQYSITVPGDPQHRTIRYSYRGNSTERDVDPGTNVVNVRF